MELKEIREVLEQAYPATYAMDWDNVGLLAGRKDKEVNTIYLALDATDEVVDAAIREGADLLLTHHPLVFSPLKKITDEGFIGRRLIRMIQADLSYYAMHTNYDVMRMGEVAAQMLGLKGQEVLDVTAEDPVRPEGIGRVGDLEETMTLESCGRMVKETFHLPGIRAFGDRKTKIRRLAVCPGSGKSEIKAALSKEADVLVTGDIDHHAGIDAVAQGLCIIDAGHYGIEQIYVADMKAFCERHFPEVRVVAAPVAHPFWTA